MKVTEFVKAIRALKVGQATKIIREASADLTEGPKQPPAPPASYQAGQ